MMFLLIVLWVLPTSTIRFFAGPPKDRRSTVVPGAESFRSRGRSTRRFQRNGTRGAQAGRLRSPENSWVNIDDDLRIFADFYREVDSVFAQPWLVGWLTEN